jgi:hypothetical protein
MQVRQRGVSGADYGAMLSEATGSIQVQATQNASDEARV